MKIMVALVLIALFGLAPAHADKWLPPKPETYTSRYATYRLTIFPAPPDGTPNALDKNIRCEAVLERLADGHRRYEQVWRKPLVNRVAPVSALVSQDNGTFVTFDNWGSKGYGDDVVAIYSASGTLIRRFALKALMSEAEVNRLPRTASSIHWGGPHELDYDNTTLNLKIVAAEGITAGEIVEGFVEQEGEFRTIRIDMRNGKVLAKGYP